MKPSIIKLTILSCNDIHIGNSVCSSRDYGNFVYRGGKLIIDAEGDVFLDSGFILENGAEVIIMSKGQVNITGGLLTGNSSLKIKADRINLIRNFECQRGSTIEFDR